MKILDCTLRDGGYYNNWDFDPSLVEAYLKAAAASGIDCVELGLRGFPQPGFFGAFAYTTESFLDRMELPAGPVYGVMVNAATILHSKRSVEDAVDALFVDANQSKVQLVRVAAHLDEVAACQDIAGRLKNKGYLVGLNLMQIGGCEHARLEALSATIAGWGNIDVLYFADSFGNMDGSKVARTVNTMRRAWTGELGIHTHNNMGAALQNTMEAHSLGVEWLDATVTGMGRGAGNTPTETLLASLAPLTDKYSASDIYELAVRFFAPLKKHYGWGDSLLYFLGAQNDVHPSYIQSLLSSSHSGAEEIIGAIDYLSRLEGSAKYDGETLQTALSLTDNSKTPEGMSDIRGLFADREVLLVGAGPSVEKYLDAIYTYIEDRKPIVVMINVHDTFDSGHVDYYCIIRNAKFLAESKKYRNINKAIVLPLHRFREDEMELLPTGAARLSYGIQVVEGEFEVKSDYCLVPNELTVGYALAAANAGGAGKISLVGFDGFDAGDPRQKEMSDLLALVHDACPGLEVQALTPTSYPVKLGSVYAPAD